MKSSDAVRPYASGGGNPHYLGGGGGTWASHQSNLIEPRRAPEAGTLALDGRMIDRPHLVQARRLLAAAGE